MNLEDGRAVVTMQIKDKYKPIYKDATILLRPEDRAEGHDPRARPGHAEARRRDARRAGASRVGQHASRREPGRGARRAGRRHARLPADPAERRRHRVPRHQVDGHRADGLAGPPRDLQALRAHRSRTACDITKRLHQAAQEHQPRHPQLPGALHRPRCEGQAARRASWTRRTPTSRPSPRRRGACARRSRCSPAALRRRPPRSRDVNTLAKELGPTLEGLLPFARELAPSLTPPAPVPARHHADHQEPDPALRARRAADRSRPALRHEQARAGHART